MDEDKKINYNFWIKSASNGWIIEVYTPMREFKASILASTLSEVGEALIDIDEDNGSVDLDFDTN